MNGIVKGIEKLLTLISAIILPNSSVYFSVNRLCEK